MERVESEAKKTGKRFEIWVTVTGKLEASIRRSPTGPCDPMHRGVYGHLGAYPAQINVERFFDIEVKENPHSPYDYANLYHGPL